jgi:hypothetical protein
MQILSDPNINYIEINISKASMILNAWLARTNHYLKTIDAIGLNILKKTLPVSLGDECKFFYLKDLTNNSFCLIGLEFTKNKEINIAATFHTPDIFCVSKELRIKIKKIFINSLINIFKNASYSTLKISVTNQKQRKFYIEMDFKMLDRENPDILTYHLKSPSDSKKDPFKFFLYR